MTYRFATVLPFRVRGIALHLIKIYSQINKRTAFYKNIEVKKIVILINFQ